MSKNLADNIVALRKKHGLSQEQFAEKIGVTRQAVSNWECRIATPVVETLDLIAKLFDTDLTALVNGESTAAEKPKDKMTFSKNEYLICPCKVSSIPYWKSKSITVPDGMCIVHKDNFNKTEYQHYIDEPYFRLIHSLQDLSIQVLPQGYLLYNATLKDFAEHINSCYSGICVTEADLRDYTARPVYDSSLWLAIKNNQTDEVVATGIAELDKEVGEGVLEWIQVSEQYRGYGLGKYVVSELLWQMKENATFATVSGQCNNPTNPEALYRKCGFTGSDVWHVLRKR